MTARSDQWQSAGRPKLNATAIAIDSVKKLSDEFERLKSTGVKVDRMLFYTHGDPGGVHFGTSVLTAKRFGGEFGGKNLTSFFCLTPTVSFRLAILDQLKPAASGLPKCTTRPTTVWYFCLPSQNSF